MTWKWLAKPPPTPTTNSMLTKSQLSFTQFWPILRSVFWTIFNRAQLSWWHLSRQQSGQYLSWFFLPNWFIDPKLLQIEKHFKKNKLWPTIFLHYSLGQKFCSTKFILAQICLLIKFFWINKKFLTKDIYLTEKT